MLVTLKAATAPIRNEKQLHVANVELVALDDAEIKYSTVQNWYPGDKDGVGGIYNFVTKRGICRGKILKFLGHKLKPDLQLHGSILVVFCKEIILWGSFIQ
jgi:hypothetical protein